ncbi:transporter substrate-binding domain-containing protein [Pseudogracilibacillus sp. SE30717A]|uniref:transporter substrate-binding domain-containing protein n=1 Tax=Pseudogracilibacillus sp. SE30717A TaxID=3098293 RepID=UPI00300DF824
MYRKLLLTLFLSLLIGVLAACGGSSESDAGETESATDDGAEAEKTDGKVYTVATDNAYVPFEYLDEESGDLVGFDIDLITALAEEAGIEIEIETLEFAGIVAGLGSGKFDIGIAGMTITEERKENIDFTQPYYEAGLILAVTEENADEIQSIDDVDGKVVATRQGSTSQEYLEENTEATPEAFPEIVEAYQNVLAGRADAVLYDLPNVQYYSEKEAGGKLKTVGEKLTGEDYGIGFPKGSELRDKIDDALTTIKENGTYDDIYEKWFGERPEGTEK